MLEILARVCDEGGQLVGVTCALFDGEHRWCTAVELRFENMTVLFRAVSDDDTLATSIGPLVPEADEMAEDVSALAPWPACIGLGVCWGWQLTNHRGYADGVRLEFGVPGEAPCHVVEFVVIASRLEVYVTQTDRRGYH